MQLFFVWGVPESPRWMISKDRHEEALQTLAKWHANGNDQDLTVQFEFREIGETLRLEKQADRTSSYMDFFRTKGNRWRLAIIISIGIISQYSGNAVISNYANLIYEGAGITSQQQKLGLNLGNTTLSLIVSISAAFMVDKVGRRPLFLVAIFGMVGSFTLWTAMAGLYESHNNSSNYGIAQIVFVWVFGIFYAIGFSGLLVAYTLEVLPFQLRAKGIMIMNITVQAILAISAQSNPVAIHNLPHAWNFWLFYTVSLPEYLNRHDLNSNNSPALGLRRSHLGLLRLRRDQGPHSRRNRQDLRRRGRCCCSHRYGPDRQGDRDSPHRKGWRRPKRALNHFERNICCMLLIALQKSLVMPVGIRVWCSHSSVVVLIRTTLSS
jgi:hypothetical protein